ncbi:SSI family serine proteinase inhibitor [Actinoplanes sp. NPDC051859]|uniref:SSI family serine proteinase inhibitor n=1 Tax=Actinoplanes sp. NPDC051859 TaxID=3363909 RepID=UPI00378E4850
MIRTIGLSAVLVLAGVAAAAPATAAPAAKKKTELTLSYTAEAGYAAAVVLRCDPAGGPHPKKGKACAALAKVNGNPAKLKPANTMCTMEYAPITAEITGKWQGKKVKWTQQYGNPCEMTRATGVVLAF